MTPLDLFLGIVQPILYEVGTRWDKGELSIVQEHQFTAFFERLFHLIYTSEENENLALRQSNQPTVLLVNAPGNFHTLGIRIVELWLISKQISCYTVYPGIPVPDIIALVASLKPVVLGISVSLPEQFNSLFELEDKLWKTPGIHPISMIVGGYAVKTRSRKEQTLLRAKLVSDLDSFLMEVTQAIDLKRESKARAG
jgi:methanogenic corrinoid protein MtbC1